MEEQGAATQEIARSVRDAADGTQGVTKSISGVTQTAGETGAAATEVLGASEKLGEQGGALREEVDKFLASIRM